MISGDFYHRYNYALAEIHDSFNLEKTENAVVRNGATLFGARGCSLILFDPAEENLLVSAAFGLSEAYRGKGAISPRRSLGETIDKVPVVIRDVKSDERIQYRDAALQEGIGAIVGLPLAAGSALIGALRLYFPQPRDFSLDEIQTFQAFAVQAGLAIKKVFYYASMNTAISEIQRMPLVNSKEALTSLLKSVAKYGMARGSALLLLDSRSNTLSSVVHYGLSGSYITKGPVFIQSLGEVTSGQPVVVSNTQGDARVQYKEAAESENVKAILGLPVRIGNRIAGAMRLYYPFEFNPGPDYIAWMEHLAVHVGIALEKNQLLNQLKERADWYEDVLRDLER